VPIKNSPENLFTKNVAVAMKKLIPQFSFAIPTILFLLIIVLSGCGTKSKESADEVYQQFQQPDEKYLPIAYWFWNGEMNPDSIRWQLTQMKKSGTVSGAVIMAWEGLAIKYLSDLWFERVKFACDVAKELGLKIWLYDEILWPSGYAGGEVLRENPELHARCLGREIHEVSGPKSISLDLPEKTVTVIICQKKSGKTKIISWREWNIEKNGNRFKWQVPAGDWKVEIFYEQQCQFHPTFQETGYVDLLNPATVQKFIELTHEKYYRLMPEYFGDPIAAIITDEPGLYCDLRPYLINPGAVPFTPKLFEEFKKIKKYDLRRYLPALWENIGEETIPVRVDFYDFLGQLFSKSYLEPLQKWCANHDIKLNIQPVHEETMKYDALLQGDYFQVMRYSDIPGCDEVYNWDRTNLTPKLASSAAHLLGENEIYCEVFGVYGWDLSLAKMKAVADWLFARGVNRFQLSSFYFTTFNDNWRMEIPPSLFYQNTQWKYMNFFTDYLERLSTILTKVKIKPKIALYRPNLSLRAVLSVDEEAAADSLDKNFTALGNFLLQHQIDFLFVNDDILARKTKISAKNGNTKLHISTGAENLEFDVLLMPFAEVVTREAFEKIKQFEEKGGTVLWFGKTVRFLLKGDKFSPAERLRKISTENIIPNYFSDTDSLLQTIKRTVPLDVEIFPRNSAIEALHGSLDDAEIFFISNNDSVPWQGTISLTVTGTVEVWDPETGVRQVSQHAESEKSRTNISVKFAPYGSKLFVVKKESGQMIVTPLPREKREIALSRNWKFAPADNSFPEEIRTIGSWTAPQNSAPAHPNFSGTGIYRSEFELPDEYFKKKSAFILRIEKVREVAEVRVNGKLAGVRCWQPYEFDLTPFVRAGKNELEIRVTNTPANHYMLVRQKYLFGEKWGKVVDSGLLGKVRIIIFSN